MDLTLLIISLLLAACAVLQQRVLLSHRRHIERIVTALQALVDVDTSQQRHLEEHALVLKRICRMLETHILTRKEFTIQ